MLLAFLGVVSITLTSVMFATKRMLLGYPSLIFWAILGGHAFNESFAAWDIYYFIFIASLLGMVPFCAFAMYALREKRDTIGDEEMEKGESEQYVDEGAPERKTFDDFDDEELAGTTSRRTQEVRENARKRKQRAADRYGWGEK